MPSTFLVRLEAGPEPQEKLASPGSCHAHLCLPTTLGCESVYGVVYRCASVLVCVCVRACVHVCMHVCMCAYIPNPSQRTLLSLKTMRLSWRMRYLSLREQ